MLSKDLASPEVDAYLAAVPEPARTTLRKVREMIRAAVPTEATEGISYGMPAFHYNGPLLGYAAFSDHCGLFAMHGTFLDSFRDDLKEYKRSKGGFQFALDQSLPAVLINKLVKARIELNASKKRR